jgi:hypothetical protein
MKSGFFVDIMDLNKLKAHTLRLKSMLEEYKNSEYSISLGKTVTIRVRRYFSLRAEAFNVLSNAKKLLPDSSVYCSMVLEDIKGDIGIGSMKICTNRIIELIDEELAADAHTEEGKLFDSARDKFNAAGKACIKGDHDAVLSCLNTSLELALKKKLEIPTVLPGINTSNVLDILISEKIGPVEHLEAVQKFIVPYDNAKKHLGLKTRDLHSVKALKAMEDFLPLWERADIKLSNDVKDKIYSGLKAKEKLKAEISSI